MNGLEQLFDRLWEDYQRMNPEAKRIHGLLQERGELIRNDHIALRTIDDPRVGVDVMARVFLKNGYHEGGRYDFPAKKLNARHYEHENPDQPKIFISELRLADMSEETRSSLVGLLGQAPADLAERPDFCASGQPWELSHVEYDKLRAESEYAAWVSAFGFRANHFTIYVNALKTFSGIRELVDFLKAEGFQMNSSGGEIKGSKLEYLEQASTLAPNLEVEFSGGIHEIPSCYYEFAQRYEMPDGKLFQGFIAKSADKIFESTNLR